MIQEKELSNEFKNTNESFLKSQSFQKIAETPIFQADLDV
jgi:hypothetical protein